MTQHDPSSTPDGQPGGDALTAAIQRLEAGMREMATRLDALALRSGQAAAGADLDAIRRDVARLGSLLETTVDDVRRLRDDGAGMAAAMAATGRELGEMRAGFAEVRTELLQLRKVLDRAAEAEPRLGAAEQRLHDVEQELGGMRTGLSQSVARALDGVADVYGEIEQLRQRLAATDDRIGLLEQVHRQRAVPGVLGFIRDEIVAAAMLAVSVGAVAGRLALSLVR